MLTDIHHGIVMRNRAGFTLLELSVTLIIVGLLAGGVLLTRSLIREAKLRAVLVEYDVYLKAVQEFQDKYQALPGDMLNATSLWGTAGVCPNTVDTTLPQLATCNGNGNGRIGASTTAGALSSNAEWWQAWQHLANAGLIDGRYNGAYGSGGAAHAVIGTNVPESRLTPGGWTLLYLLRTSDGGGFWADNYGHLLFFGAASTASYTGSGILLPSEALALDLKIDDGRPGLGKLRPAGCYTGASQSAAIYQKDTEATNCPIYFILGF
jgi:prepilin-type N-terminal cleavage/methylation domain-containing protein